MMPKCLKMRRVQNHQLDVAHSKGKVIHYKLMFNLENTGIDPAEEENIRELVLLEQYSKKIEIQRGVGQGYIILPPLLFNTSSPMRWRTLTKAMRQSEFGFAL